MIKSQILLATALALITAPAWADVQITDAYARGTGASGAVYLTMANPDATPDRLISVTTDAAQMAMLHTSVTDAAGVTSMPDLPDGVIVSPGTSHAFARGGDHIMLMGLTKPIKDGDRFRVTLLFERSGAVEVDVIVDNKRLK